MWRLRDIHRRTRRIHQPADELPQLRFEIIEAARTQRLSWATLYERIRTGEIRAQKDGRRRYTTAAELQRYDLVKGP